MGLGEVLLVGENSIKRAGGESRKVCKKRYVEREREREREKGSILIVVSKCSERVRIRSGKYVTRKDMYVRKKRGKEGRKWCFDSVA